MKKVKKNGSIGIFDSGLGGLCIMKNIVKMLPEYNYLYYGDTAHMPYGSRSQESIYKLTRQGVDYLFRHGCQLVIIACNTASAKALRKIQKGYLKKYYPARRVLGVVIPTAEEAVAAGRTRIGVLATPSTSASRVFTKELKKLHKKVFVAEQSAPALGPLIQYDGLQWAALAFKESVTPLLKKNVEAIILGCTHYAVIKHVARKVLGKSGSIISQDEVIPKKLKEYLRRHHEIDQRLSKTGKKLFVVTDRTVYIQKKAHEWFGHNIIFKKI